MRRPVPAGNPSMARLSASHQECRPLAVEHARVRRPKRLASSRSAGLTGAQKIGPKPRGLASASMGRKETVRGKDRLTGA